LFTGHGAIYFALSALQAGLLKKSVCFGSTLIMRRALDAKSVQQHARPQ
jgi:hypothetical protein